MGAFYITAWQTWSPSRTRRQKRFILRSQIVQFNPIPVFGAKKIYQNHLTENFHWSFRRNVIKALMVSCRRQRKPELRPDWSSPQFSAISIHHFHIAQNTPFYPKRLHKHPYSSSISLGATVTRRRCLYQVFPQGPQISWPDSQTS